MKRPYKANRRSFTLVEMVVAMGIMMVVALIIGSASMTFYNGYRRTTRVTERLKACRAIDLLLDQNIRNLIPFQWRDELNVTRFVFDGKTDSLHFTTLRRSYPGGKGALLFIRIRVDNEELIADYSYYPRLPWAEEGTMEYTSEVVAKGVRGIRFLYAEEGEEEIEFLDYWEEDDHRAVPLAIQMTVEWLDGSTEVWLRRTAGSAANSTFGSRQTPL